MTPIACGASGKVPNQFTIFAIAVGVGGVAKAAPVVEVVPTAS